MIKRAGVEVMNARTKNVSIARETIQVCKDKQYTSLSGNVVDISQSIDAALAGTILYKSDADLSHFDGPFVLPTIEVTNETTAQAAVRLAALGKNDIVALNFASAHCPGGGFLAGAIAQEEDLCRASGLYPCIKSKPIFYNENILCDNSNYTHNIIYSPKVPFFRNESNLFLDDPFTLSIATSPAPKVRGKTLTESEEGLLDICLKERAKRILNVAAIHGHKNIVLGAWGCGAFGNNPWQVSEAFQYAMKHVPAFDHITFAVYDTRPEKILYNTFVTTFSNEK